MTRISRLFDGIAEWCRTRWIALHWFFRLIVVVLVAVNSFAFVYALVTGNGSGLLTSLSGLTFAYIVTDWQYWMERDRLGYPFARIGAAVTARLHRGDQKVVIRNEGDQWVMSNE